MRRPKFGPHHPLWNELVGLRRAGVRIEDLRRVAEERGYALSWRQLYRALEQAPALLGLPGRSSNWLIATYGGAVDDFEEIKMLRALFLHGIDQLRTYYQMRTTAQSEARRITLDRSIPELLDKLMDWGLRLGELVLKWQVAFGAVPGVEPRALPPGERHGLEAVPSRRELTEGIERLTVEYTRKLGGGSAEEGALEEFGRDNVRPAVEADWREVDEEEGPETEA